VHCFSGVVWSVASTLPTNHYTDGTAIALCRTAHRCPGLIAHRKVWRPRWPLVGRRKRCQCLCAPAMSPTSRTGWRCARSGRCPGGWRQSQTASQAGGRAARLQRGNIRRWLSL